MNLCRAVPATAHLLRKLVEAGWQPPAGYKPAASAAGGEQQEEETRWADMGGGAEAGLQQPSPAKQAPEAAASAPASPAHGQ